MARNTFNLLILILVSGHAFASDPLLTYSVPAEDCACDPNVHDNFEKPIRFGYGEFAGQCVNSCHFRAEFLISHAKDGQARFANLYHKYKYWFLDVDLSKIESADLLLERFTFGVDHVMLRLHLSKDSPGKLTPQSGHDEASYINDIIVSIEGVPPKNVHGHLWEGMRGSYLLVYRILSLDQLADWAITKHHHPIRQYRLKIPTSDLQNILLKAAVESEQKSFKEAYLLFSENCATNAIELATNKTNTSFEEGFSSSLPLFNTLHALDSEGYVDYSKKTVNVEAELGLTP